MTQSHGLQSNQKTLPGVGKGCYNLSEKLDMFRMDQWQGEGCTVTADSVMKSVGETR